MTPPESSGILEKVFPWPFVPVLNRMGMAVAVGILIGLEREHREKTGVRTFAITALLGCVGGFMGNLFSIAALCFVAMIIVGINYKEAAKHGKLVITTSAALAVVGFTGVLFGQGHVFTPVAASVITAALLAWKGPIARFALGLSDQELRSAILLAILTFVIWPVLPSHPVDPWGLVEPRSNWASVIIIAGIGFVNYILMKTLGPRGMEITAFFGGLVNSRKVIVELTSRIRDSGTILLPVVHRGILLATASMLIRNALIIGILAPQTILQCIFPLASMFLIDAWLWWRSPVLQSTKAQSSQLGLESPFKLSAALKFGLVFLILNVVGILAQRKFGSSSFYFVSIAGGLLSSASSIASAATLVNQHGLPALVGASGVLLSSITSILANIPLIRGLVKERELKKKLCSELTFIAALGLVIGVINHVAAVKGWL